MSPEFVNYVLMTTLNSGTHARYVYGTYLYRERVNCHKLMLKESIFTSVFVLVSLGGIFNRAFHSVLLL